MQYRLLTPRRIRAYPALTFLVIAGIALYNRLAGSGLHDAIHGWLGGDFLSFYTAGSFVAEGHPENLNDYGAQAAFQEGVLGKKVDDLSAWVSPPVFAFVFVPFSRLPYAAAYVTFVAVGVAIMIFTFRLLRSEFPSLPTPTVLLWLGLQFYPTLQWLLNGQTTMLWFLLFGVTFVCLRRGEDVRAGLVLGCFACKPVLALGVVTALAAARRYKTLFFAGVSAATWLIVGFTTLPEAMLSYSQGAGHLVSVVREPGYPVVDLYGSFEVGMLLLDGISRRGATIFGVVLSALVLGLIARIWITSDWKPATREWDFRMAAILALGIIASPHLYGYDLTLLLLPLLIVAANYEKNRVSELPLDGGHLLALTALVWALALVSPVLALLQRELSQQIMGTAVAIQYGTVAIGLWGYRVWRSAEQPEKPHFA